MKECSKEELAEAVEKRMHDLLTRYKGKINEYDLNNEMAHGDFFSSKFGEEYNANLFKKAVSIDPAAAFYVNDYGILTGDDADKFINHTRNMIEAGAPVGGIGCQGHFRHGTFDKLQVSCTLNRLSRFGLPVKITEFDINSSDESHKAHVLREVYRTAFANPYVNGILMWGFWEKKHWIPKAALWKKDFSPTESALAYRDLVFNEWFTQETVTVGDTSEVTLPVFFGTYKLSVNGKEYTIDLPASRKKVSFTVPSAARH